MKTIKKVNGYTIKEVTPMDVKKKDFEEYKLGELSVFNPDGQEEFDGIGTLREALEVVEGLRTDKLNDKKKNKK